MYFHDFCRNLRYCHCFMATMLTFRNLAAISNSERLPSSSAEQDNDEEISTSTEQHDSESGTNSRRAADGQGVRKSGKSCDDEPNSIRNASTRLNKFVPPGGTFSRASMSTTKRDSTFSTIAESDRGSQHRHQSQFRQDIVQQEHEEQSDAKSLDKKGRRSGWDQLQWIRDLHECL